MSRKDFGKEIGMFFLMMTCGICAIFMGIAIGFEHLYEPTDVIRYIEFTIFVTSGSIMTVLAYIKLINAGIKYWGVNHE